jgi:hypothetical protein
MAPRHASKLKMKCNSCTKPADRVVNKKKKIKLLRRTNPADRVANKTKKISV